MMTGIKKAFNFCNSPGNGALSIMFSSLFLSVIIFSSAALADDSRSQDSFHVKPGAGTLSVEAEVKNYKCKFSYAAQGGTDEEWHMSLELLDKGTAVMCSVERPSKSSYLFFEDFKLELKGPKVSITDVDLKDSQRDNKNLMAEEYIKEKTSVSSVKGSFKNHLEKVAVFSPLNARDDL